MIYNGDNKNHGPQERAIIQGLYIGLIFFLIGLGATIFSAIKIIQFIVSK